MAHNHRGQPIADPFLNMRQQMLEQQAMLAERNAGLMGVNYDPEQADYDEAFGPADRVRRPLQSRLDMPAEYEAEGERMQDRRVKGQN
jgi:hypothetical protein